MYTLMSGIYETVFARQECRCLVIGLDNSGKTTLLEQLKAAHGLRHMDTAKITPTIGFNVAKIRINNIDSIFWDLGGHPNFRVVWQNYFEEIDGIVFVVDSSDGNRVQEARKVMLSVFDHHLIKATIPVLILANKQDRENALSIAELHRLFGIEEISGSRAAAVHVQPCSALKNTGLVEGVKWLIDETVSGSAAG